MPTAVEALGGRQAAANPPFLLHHAHGASSARSASSSFSSSSQRSSKYTITADDLPRFATAERILAEEAGRESAATFLALDEGHVLAFLRSQHGPLVSYNLKEPCLTFYLL